MGKIFKLISVSISLIIVMIIYLLVVYISKENLKQTIEINSPVVLQSNSNVDLNGDGLLESIKIIELKDNKLDVEITTDKQTIALSSLTNNNYLSYNIDSYPMNVRLLNISRDNKPEILVQGFVNNTPIIYLFNYESNKFKLKYSSNYNIAGFVNSDLNKTPQISFLNSSNLTDSLKTFMLINNDLIDITKHNKSYNGILEILKLIDIICLQYEVIEYPPIFHTNAYNENISPLWELEKDKFKYSFINGFFYDNNVDNEGNLQNIKWTLYFVKTNKESSKKDTFIIDVDSSRDEDNTFKISNIQRIK